VVTVLVAVLLVVLQAPTLLSAVSHLPVVVVVQLRASTLVTAALVVAQIVLPLGTETLLALHRLKEITVAHLPPQMLVLAVVVHLRLVQILQVAQ
jgi:hypothetical protein